MERKTVHLSFLVMFLVIAGEGNGQSTEGSTTKDQSQSHTQELSHSSDVEFVCERPSPPKGASMRCHQSNDELKCIAQCIEGFHFPDTYPEVIELECDSNGEWYPQDTFPDCNRENLGTFNWTHYSQNHPWEESDGNQTQNGNAYQQHGVGLVCERPDPPNGSSMRCHQSNDVLKCTAQCIEGFHFPDTYPEVIELECDANGEWYPQDTFPDCIGEESQGNEMNYGNAYRQHGAYDHGGYNAMSGMDDSICAAPRAPTGGTMNCVQRNGEMSCSAVCSDGFQFPDGYPSTIQITCDESGDWEPYDEFPDCIGGSGYNQEQSHYGYGQSDYDYGQSTYDEGQSSYGEGVSGYSQGQSSYGEGLSGYGEGLSGYGEGLSGYGQGQSSYGEGLAGYGQAQSEYGQGLAGYGQAQSEYGQGLAGFGQAQSEYGQGLSGYGRGQSENGQGEYYEGQQQYYADVCSEPPSPYGGSMRCVRRNEELLCSATCNEGYSFPESYPEAIQIMCNINGDWNPYDDFPDCVDSRTGAHDQYYQEQQRENDYDEKSYLHGQGQRQQQQVWQEDYDDDSSLYSSSFSSSSSSMLTGCTKPAAPRQGTIHCMNDGRQMQCQATCNPGYEFPDRTRQATITCDLRSGYWMPKNRFEDCGLLCHPPCQNGGQCGHHGVCSCLGEYRGNRCQYPIALCDFNRLHPRMVAFECTHNSQFSECHVSCPPGMVFDPPSTTQFRCTVDGHWVPPVAPSCVRNSACDQPPSPMNGRIACSGNNEKMTCTGSCRAGYVFPDGFSELVIQCSYHTGQWSPAVNFEDCVPICNPRCQNGGKCIGHNQCLCTSEYRGAKCEYAISNCDYHAFFGSVVVECTVDQKETTCHVGCGDSAALLVPPRPVVYTCSLDGTWTPGEKPVCESDHSLIDMRTGKHKNKFDYWKNVEEYKSQNRSSHQTSSIHSSKTRFETTSGFQQMSEHGQSGQSTGSGNKSWRTRGSSGFGEGFDYSEEHGSNAVVRGQGQGGHDISWQSKNRHGQQSVDYDADSEQPQLDSWTNDEDYDFMMPQTGEDMVQKTESPQTSSAKGYPGSDMEYERVNADGRRIPITTTSSHKGVCSVWGHTHIRTFDGTVYDFPGTCSYILMKDAEHEGRSISLAHNCDYSSREMYMDVALERMRESEESFEDCVREVELQLPGELYKLSPVTKVTLNGNQISIPVRRATGVTIEKVSHYTVAKFPGFSVWMNDEGTIRIEADSNKKGKTAGLCGDFDHQNDNFQSPTGGFVRDITTFGNSWKSPSSTRSCVDSPPPHGPCQSDTREHRIVSDKSSLLCESLRGMEYSECHQLVNPQDYYTMCQMDCCTVDTAEGCECASLDEYFKECARVGGNMGKGWRRPALCPLACTNGTEYRECGPACPSTCARQDPTCTHSKCVDGCFCPDGSILEGGRCIPTSDCPCSHGKSKYASGETMQNDCNTCICQGGMWQCTEEICPATCYVSGPHFTTFDGQRYYLHSKCPHYLVYDNEFSISIDYSTNCREMENSQDEEPICVRSISILTTEDTIVKLKPGFEVVVNGKEFESLPVSAPGIHISQSTSMFMKAIMKSGLEILWDGGQQIFVKASVELYDDTRGLCGTFNHKQADDFLTPDGDIESVASSFTEKWKVEPFCEDHDKTSKSSNMRPCDRNTERYDEAARACSILKTAEIFEECHGFVDPLPYYTSCMEDLCECQLDQVHCLCTAIASYAAVCARKKHPVPWRSEIQECAIHCPIGLVYTDCAKSCSYSCAEMAKPAEECQESCVEGCVCPPGETMDDEGHMCIPVSSCHCTDRGKSFPPEFRQRRGHEMCECALGQWACHAASAKELILNPPTPAIECHPEAHMEPTDCVSHCPLTCSNLDKHAPCTQVTCEAGCKCEDGYVFDGSSGKCVEPHECPCHHAGHGYGEGTKIRMECNDCVCSGGHWDCQSNPCPGLCSVWGNSHYKTFDGRTYDFQGECNYELLRTPSTDNSVVSVVVHNLPCGTHGVTCGKAVTVSLGEYSVTLSKEEPMPTVDPMSGISIQEIGMFVVVHIDGSISVQWDKSTRIYVTAQPLWESKLLGLCGDFNGDATDDFKPPSGGVPLSLPEEFADTWKAYDYCSPATNILVGCENNPEKRVWAREKCSVLQTELFEPCHTLVDSEEYYRRCMDDACACDIGGDCDCLCEVVATYAQECARKGVSIHWRSQELCPIQCEECDHYTPCIDICAPVNCENYQDDSVSTCTFEPCVEGCEPKDCPSGFIRTGAANRTCIKIEDCAEKPCIVLESIAYKEGAIIDSSEVGDVCQSCFCHEGEISCEGLPCTTTTPRPPPTWLPPIIECEHDGWSEWINSVRPSENEGDDLEDIQALIAKHIIPCSSEYITDVECRKVNSTFDQSTKSKPSKYSSSLVTCDMESGLSCGSTGTEDCEDHEIRVYCDCPEEELCPQGQHSDECAYECGSMCQSLEMDYLMTGQCTGEEDKCIPGCVEKTCESPFLRRDAETCVLAESCTCKLENGTLLAPGATGTFGCQKCQCLNNELICMLLHECISGTSEEIPELTTPVFIVKETISPAFAIPTTTMIITPTTGVPQILPFSPLTTPRTTTTTPFPIPTSPVAWTVPPIFSTPPPITTLPPIFTQPPPPHRPPIAVEELLPEEIFTTPFTTTTPGKTLAPFIITSTIACSHWSDWINENSPQYGPNGGDREDTLPYILTQTEGFCHEGAVTHIECETTDGLDYTVSKDEALTCNLQNGFSCNNRDQPDQRLCEDYKIRYYCDCEAVETTTILVPTTTKTYVYPCHDYMQLIDGYRPLPDSSLKVSSSRSPNEGPESARLKTQAPGRKGKMTLLGGSWTAKVSDRHQYIEVDLGDISAIYGIKTLGKAGSNDRVTAYQIVYSTDGSSYNFYADEFDNTKIFPGNYDSSTMVEHIFETPFEARYVRIEPVTWENTISLRFDVLGCAEVVVTTTPIPGEYVTTVKPITPIEEVCKDSMGLEEGMVADFQLSASTARDALTAAKEGRLGSELPWVPSTLDQNPYLQVDFVDLKNISGIITKGDEGEEAWVTAFKVQYSKDGKTWNKVADEAGYSKEFPANYDGSSLVTNLLPSTIRTRFVRVLPTNHHNSVALQIEVLGCYHPIECRDPMGVEDGLVDNNQMSASSEREDALSAEIGRLNSLKAWSPLSANKEQFLQVDFLEPMTITGVVTKGRTEALEWVRDYEVSYSSDKKRWILVRDEDGEIMKFRANTDTDTPVINLLPEPIETRYVRIIPQRWIKWPSLRIELLGCLEKQKCIKPMGLENGLIKDSQIISSSDFDDSSASDQARIKSDGAWSPKPSDNLPFLEIDFGIPQNVSAVVTKGRENGLPEGWVTSYKISYKDKQGDYELFRDDRNKVQVFEANDDEDSPVVNVLGEDPIETSAIRIIPLTWEGAPNLRVEVLGCLHPIECQEPMGMENGMIMDGQLSASSSLGNVLDPGRARLNSDSGWSAGEIDEEQYIMVDLMESRNITGLLTSGHGLLEQRVVSYIVEYSVDDITWDKVMRDEEIAKFSGSLENNLNQPVLSMFEEPIKARYVKIRPTEWKNWISMRFEVLGCYHPYVCKEPMGIENGIITDSQITASSYFNDTTSPFYARLYGDSAWIPKESDKEPYLQIELSSLQNVTAIITKGDSVEEKYVTLYQVMYSDDGINWNKVVDQIGFPMEFKADRDNENPVINVLPHTVESKFIRIIPIDWFNQIAMQVEVLGCAGEEVLPMNITTTPPAYAPSCPHMDDEVTSLMEKIVIKASSSAPNSSPYLVQLNTVADLEEDLTGGWVPKVGDAHPYLILEFPETRLLTTVTFQGRQDADQRVKYFKVMASMDNSTWVPVFGPDGNEFIEGNLDSPAAVEHYFKEPVNATFVKVIPEEWHKWPSFRMDLQGCYHPTEVTTVVPLPPPLCPEVPLALENTCPDTCAEGKYCDGEGCVDAADCSCVKDGRIHEVGSIFYTHECEKCQCVIGGHSKCTKKDCPPCPYNQEPFFGPKCECECKKCPEDTEVCPTSGECLPIEKWCDGITDCPDDETNCPTRPSEVPLFPTTTTTVAPRTEIMRLLPTAATTTTPAPPLPILVPDTCEIQSPNIKLFNGPNILYKPCHHTVLTDVVNGEVDVTMHNVPGRRSIEIKTKEHNVKITTEKEVELDGHEYTASQLDLLSKKPGQSLIIEILGDHVIVNSPDIGFEISYSTLGHLTVKVLPSLKEQIVGLCGFYTDDKSQTLLKPDETVAYINKDFGDSWATDEGNEDCKEPVCDLETRSLGLQACNELKSEDFKPCAAVVDIKDYIPTCQEFMCECLEESTFEECKCKSFMQVVEKCMNKLGEDVLKGWRVKHHCPPPPCPEGFVWEDCGPSCQITCETLASPDYKDCSKECMSGCFCPTGTLLDRDKCVSPDKCSNEVCHGFGDPHMETFDGYFFPMQAEGTFLFAADEGAEFAVQGITEPCRPGSKKITCITGIKVTHYGHTVTVSKNEQILVDDEIITVEKWPLNVYGMTVIGYPGKTFVVLITSLGVDVRYYADNSGFAIKIPATRFFNRTLGLCGNCDGKVAENPKKEYACGWLVEGNKQNCLDSFDELPPVVDTVDSCLALMDDEVFGTCHPLVNPKQYVDACSFDVAYSGEEEESVCKTLKEYARQCCQAGVVIDKWPEKFGCDVGCENNLEYSSCHDGCPQTCESTKNSFLVLGCEKIMLDGCFCPEGSVFKDGKCIENELCDACDDEGHMPGDSWSPESCTNCTCRSNLMVECSTESCPPKPICKSDESIVKQNSNDHTCCDIFFCVPSPISCPPVEDFPTCGEGEIVKSISDDDLCPKFQCVCNPVTCASVTYPQDLEDGQVVNIDKEGCCPKVKVECDFRKCPDKPECTGGLIPVEYEGECCALFRCKPPTDLCVYSHRHDSLLDEQMPLAAYERAPVFYRPHETWQDGPCENCTCEASNGQLRPVCVKEQCPNIENMSENKDYEIVEYPNPDQCCPDIFKLNCKDEHGNAYEPGEEWQSDEDPCTNFVCEATKHGDALKTKMVTTCPECPKTSDYVPPSKILGQCCGFCRPTKCEEDGNIYVMGEEWVPESMPCRKAQCINDFGSVKIVYTDTSCPVLPEDCPLDKIVDDEQGCCRICNETTEMKCNSVPIPVEETVGFFQARDSSRGGLCQNRKAVPEIMKCSGACHSNSYFSVEDGDFKSVCQCCKVDVTIEKTIEMVCPDGSILKKKYLQPQTCQCSKCGPDKKKDLWETSGRKGAASKNSSPWLQSSNQQQEDGDEFNFQSQQQRVQQEEEGAFDFGYPQQQRVQQQEDAYDFGYPQQQRMQQQEEDAFNFGNPQQQRVQQEEELSPYWQQTNDFTQQEEEDYDDPYFGKRSSRLKKKSLQAMGVEDMGENNPLAGQQETNSKERKKRILPFSGFAIPDTGINSNDYGKLASSLWDGAKNDVGSSLSSLYEGTKEKFKDVKLPSASSLYEGAKEKFKDVAASTLYEKGKDKFKDVELPSLSSLYEGSKDRFKSVEMPSFLRLTREERKR